MRYVTTLKGQKAADVQLEPLAGGRYALTYQGQRYEVDALAVGEGTLSLLIGDESYGVELEQAADGVSAHLRGQLTRVDVADERALRMRAVGGAFQVEGRQLVTAPMPGKVVRVLVKVGDEVKEGQGLVVVEAMKMENELKSPKAGKVVELFAKEGGTVENNAKLVTVE